MKKGAALPRCTEQRGKNGPGMAGPRSIVSRPRAASPPGLLDELAPFLFPHPLHPGDARTPFSLLCPSKPCQPILPLGSSLFSPQGLHPWSVPLAPGCSSASAPGGKRGRGTGAFAGVTTLKALNKFLF